MLEELGKFMGATLERSNPINLEFYKAAAETVDSNFEDIGRTIAKCAYAAFEVFGKEASAPAQHMKILSEQEDWYPEFNEPIFDVLDTIREYHLTKRADSVLNTPGTGVFGEVTGLTLAAALLGGGAIGATAFGVNRELSEDDEDMEEMRSKITAYNDLVSEMENKLKRKYQYNEQPGEEFAG